MSYLYYDDADNRLYQLLDNLLDASPGPHYQYYNNANNRSEYEWAASGEVKHFLDQDGPGNIDWQTNAAGTELWLLTYHPGTWDWAEKITYSLKSGTTDTWEYALTEWWSSPGYVGYSNEIELDKFDTSVTQSVPDVPVFSEPANAMFIDIPEEDDILVNDSWMDELDKKIEELKSQSTGEGITVALLDTGLTYAEEDAISVVDGFDFAGSSLIDGEADADYSDANGHGTVSANIVSDTAENADILVARVYDDYNRTSSSVIADAIMWAVDKGASVLAMPLSIYPVYDKIQAAVEYAVDKGTIIVTAAGNQGTDVLGTSLAANDKIITVGSVDSDGKISAWSNVGEEVDLYAPWDIIDNEEGTSFSAAFVAGLAALVLEDNPDMTADDVLGALKKLTADIQPDVKKAEDERQEVKGEDVSEVVSMYEMLRKNRREFTGTSPKVEYKELPARQ
jgi:subtilisin family serine protease